MKILVTGCEGNIGKKLVRYLSGMGHTVFGVDIVQQYKPFYQTVDITDGAEMANIMLAFEPDVVIHLAAMVSRVTCEKSPCTTVKTNVYGTEVLIRLCRLAGAKLMFFSTSEVYGNVGGTLFEEGELSPNNLYGLSKVIGEQLVRYEIDNGLKALIVRPFMFYDEDETVGDHRSAIIRFAKDLIAGRTITVHKDAYRSWMHISDAVVVIERLCHAFDSEYLVANIGHPEAFSMAYIAHLLCVELELNYENKVLETDLPEKMTLTKFPDLSRQNLLTGGYVCQVPVEEGIVRVVKKLIDKS